MSDKRKADSTSPKSAKKPFFWNLGLKEAMKDPDLILYSDEKIVIIKDGYPKSKYHFLVMPKEDIDSLKVITRQHIDLLKHIHRIGEEYAQKIDDTATFRLGYHAVPSMRHLHMHVISQDFEGSGLKNKKHWNSFTTAFFMDSSNIIAELETNGRICVMSESKADELLKMPLRCHICKEEAANLPKLKLHIAKHKQ